MLKTRQILYHSTQSGAPIPSPFPNLTAANVQIRKGELTLVAAGPGLGKSSLVLNWVLRGDDKGNKPKTLYFSADTNGPTQVKRMASMVTGYSGSYVNEAFAKGNQGPLERAADEAAGHITFDFTSRPSWEHIYDTLSVWEMVYGEPPEVIIFDNLKDIDVGAGDDEWRGLEDACGWMNTVAHETGAAVITLHHVAGEGNENGTQPVPMSGLRGKVSKTPALILTLYRNTIDNVMHVSVVKNRQGGADPSGHVHYPLKVDLDRMSFESL